MIHIHTARYSITWLISYLISLLPRRFEAESKQTITLKTPITMEERKIWEPNQFIAGSLIVPKRQYTLSNAVIAASNEEITAKVLTGNQHTIIWEGYILSKLDHPNVVKMLGICIEQPVCLLLEKCARNSLSKYLTSWGNSPLDVSFLLKMVVDLCIGLAYLHSKYMIHRSLAARNCILSSDFSTAKVANLQRCSIVSKDEPIVTDYTNFAIGWASPEVSYKV